MSVTPLQDQVQLALGDAFALQEELPGGGMSRLFLATEVSLNRRVVVKVLPPDWASDVSAARFKREMEVAAQLQHPHILPVLAAGARTGLLYFIMPYVAGESLRARLKRDGQLPIGDAQRILAEVADALAFAHERGVIHRDIKPENILLEGKHAVLADFGVARALIEARTGERLTSTGVSVGTPGYMSPEQVAGDTVDARADVYALAVVGYEMLAGQPPFTGPTAQAVLRAHLADLPEPLRKVRPDVPAALEQAIARALGKEPGQRYATASDFQRALGETGEHPRARRLLLLRPRTLAAALIAVLLIAAVASFSTSRQRSRAILARVTPAADSGRLDEVYRILDSADADIGASALTPIAAKVAGTLRITAAPPGMEIWATRVHPIAGFGRRQARSLGRTPMAARPLVAGEYFVRLLSPTGDTLERIAVVWRDKETTLSSVPLKEQMVPIPAGTGIDASQVAAFLIGRYEVTNDEFQRFVESGGYRNDALWPDSMFVSGKWLTRARALAQFTDRSGLAGPRLWSGGKAAGDQKTHPVVGVSWYEAAAYARWSGGDLPQWPQWWRAALDAGHQPFPWGSDGMTAEQRANFGLAGPLPVGSMRLGVSPFGVHDMAGNVREWLADVSEARRRVVVGGSWQDPTYMFEPQHAERFDAGYSSPVIGFRIVRGIASSRRAP